MPPFLSTERVHRCTYPILIGDLPLWLGFISISQSKILVLGSSQNVNGLDARLFRYSKSEFPCYRKLMFHSGENNPTLADLQSLLKCNCRIR